MFILGEKIVWYFTYKYYAEARLNIQLAKKREKNRRNKRGENTQNKITNSSNSTRKKNEKKWDSVEDCDHRAP